MALSDFYTACNLLTRTEESDGFGSVVETWEDGEEIPVAIALDSSTAAQIAYKAGTKEIYTLAFPVAYTLRANDRIRRNSDGKIFRVTSDSSDMITPAMSEVQHRQCTAEVITV